MSKSGAPSASASASVSASSPSSHDPHSLPPNVKGLVQRYLAVSLPTITLTPELIDILDRSEVLIPNRIQVTMRWWKEDAACSLSVYPKLNSPLPKAIEKRQALLQQRQQLEKQQQQVEHQLQQQQLQRDRQRDSPSLLHRRSHNTLNSIAMPGPTQPQSSAQAQTQAQTQGQTQAQSRTAASFLKRPWSGARLLNVFRKGKHKSKERLGATPSAADVREIHTLTPTPTPSHRGESPAPLNAMGGHVAETETKPLPSLPDAAFPITVAYPTRCTLDQLRQYFGEMTPLTLEIQITPRLSAMTTVPNLVDLFLNIHGTFSGVFSFSTIVRNDDPRLPSELMFKNRVLLGMVVFQAWLQDTSNVDDSDEDSESISTGSMFAMLDDAPGTTPHHMHPAYHQHHRHPSHHHGPHNPPHSRPLPPPIHTVQPAQPHLPHHPPHTQHVPPPLPASSQYTHPMQRPHPPPLGPPQAPMQPREYDRTPHRIPHPLSNQYPNPQVHLQQRPPPPPQQHQQLPHQPRQQQVIPPTQAQRPPSHQVHPVYPGQPGHPMHPRHPAHQGHQGHQGHPGFPGQAYPADRDGFGHRVSMRYDEDPYPGSQHKLPSRPQASGAPGPRYPQDAPPVRDDMHPHPREHLSHSGRYQTRQPAEASGSGAGKASSRYSHGRIQAPDIGPSGGVYPTAPHPQSHHPHLHPHQHQHQHQDRQYRQQQQQQDRRDRPLVEESHDEQGSRSRPRASATAAVIGRLENVQARGNELLNAMRTSFALDPEEVRNRSARDIRSSALYHEDVEDDRYTPYHENLPYWPSRSRFSLELSIPTAYLTTEGLLRGSIQKKHSSMPLTSSSGRSSESPSHGDWGRDSPHHRPSSQQQQQQQQQRQSRHHAEYQQPRQPGSSQHQAQDPQRQDHSTPAAVAPTTAATTAATAVPPNTTTATATTPNTNTNLTGSGATGVVGSGSGTGSTPRPLRRSGKPIQFEKLASRTGDLDRLRQAQEESLRPQYQSFQSGTPEFGVSEPPASDSPKERFQPLDQYGQQRPHARGQQQPRMTDRDWDRDNSPQPRKSRSYPPPPPSKGRVHRRRLSSNDRLQLRMNPRAGDVLNYLPDLFPSKSMSALLVPEYISSSSGSSSVGSHGSSISTEDDERSQVYGYGGSGGVDLGGRQSRLQKRPHKSYRHYHSETKRHQSQRHQQYHHQQHGMSGPSSRSRRREARGSRVHPQHFNFKVNCQLQLTPEVMAACMVENISIEVWKLNSKRQTMIELGSAKLPLHKVFSRIMQKTATMSTAPLPVPPSTGSRYHSQYRDRMGPRSGYMRPSRESNAVFKEGWRLEPSVFDIRSRQGTIIGQLDAHLWIHPRSRSDSMVSAAA